MQVRKLLMISALALVLVPASAQAQSGWFFSPFIGGNFGGTADFGDFPDNDDAVERRMDFGATIGWNPRVVGFEVDFGYSPNFFENTAGDANFEFGDNNVTTLMGNLLIGAPAGRVRPYASGGLGLIRAAVSSGTGLFNDLSTNDLGVNVGGGLNAQFNDNIGVRGDLRYFRSLQDNVSDNDFDLSLGSFDFWRGSVGLTFSW